MIIIGNALNMACFLREDWFISYLYKLPQLIHIKLQTKLLSYFVGNIYKVFNFNMLVWTEKLVGGIQPLRLNIVTFIWLHACLGCSKGARVLAFPYCIRKFSVGFSARQSASLHFLNHCRKLEEIYINYTLYKLSLYFKRVHFEIILDSTPH
jgi:hypothetical protein